VNLTVAQFLDHGSMAHPLATDSNEGIMTAVFTDEMGQDLLRYTRFAADAQMLIDGAPCAECAGGLLD
jgi:hypothetical protein